MLNPWRDKMPILVTSIVDFCWFASNPYWNVERWWHANGIEWFFHHVKNTIWIVKSVRSLTKSSHEIPGANCDEAKPPLEPKVSHPAGPVGQRLERNGHSLSISLLRQIGSSSNFKHFKPWVYYCRECPGVPILRLWLRLVTVHLASGMTLSSSCRAVNFMKFPHWHEIFMSISLSFKGVPAGSFLSLVWTQFRDYLSALFESRSDPQAREIA